MTWDTYEDLRGEFIEGALGGGGSKADEPKEEDESGFSTSIANVLEVISEGVIEGIIQDPPSKGIYLDNTVIKNPGGSVNFKNVRIRTRKGLQSQSVIPDVDTVESETGVNVEIKKNQPQTRTIINKNLDAIRVRLGVQLTEYKENGDIEGSEIEFKIFIKQGNAGFVERKSLKVEGKYTQTIEFEYQFNVNNQRGTVDQFQVRVQKLTDDTTDSKTVRVLRWQAYSEIVKAKITYANTALVHMEFDAEQFQSVPSRSFNVGGVICRIPSNAIVEDTRRLTFNGEWDGSFVNPGKAVNDPIWQLYALLTNERWGMGNYVDNGFIDKWSLYECSRYNNRLVDDGLGGQEARYQCSTVLQTKEKIYDVINALCSSCNVKPYWSGGKLRFWQDRPGNVIQQFSQADVEDGDFVYSTTAVRTRFTVCYVTWNDPDDFYRQTVEIVEDADGIARYGVRETEIVAYGCVSRGQAIRMGKWALYSSLNETETISFTARAHAAFVRPGDLIQIADDKRAGIRYGGLVSATGLWANGLQIRLDSAVQIPPGSEITVVLPDNTIETLPIVTSGNTDLVQLLGYFSAIPQDEATWVIKTPSVKPLIFRVLSVATKAGDATKVEITGIEHNAGKYNEIENNIQIVEPPTRITAPTVISPPVGLTINYLEAGTQFTLLCAWQYPLDNFGGRDPYISAFFVEYKRGVFGVWQGTSTTNTAEYQFTGLPTGDYQFRVASISLEGKTSFWVESPVLSVVDTAA